MNRFRIKIGGASGGGLLSTGEIIIRALRDMGFYAVADREYPSVIKGGHACFTINISDKPVRALSEKVDVLMAMDALSMEKYIDGLKDGGVFVHGHGRVVGVKEVLASAVGRGVMVVGQDARVIAENAGGNVLMKNVVLVGMLWKAMGLDYKFIENEVKRKFASKPRLLAIDLECLKAGYDAAEPVLSLPFSGGVAGSDMIMMDGNHAIALGGIHAGCRAYYAYPMSPSSSILTHMANYADATGMLVKQVEDEISVVNMTLGSMAMGTRALCATSGGGYDLMTETVSLAGIIECPLVVVIAQRPGPATGLPTWTCQSDLHLAVYAAHGEFPRAVIAVSDAEDAFELIQHALNIAEKFQSPVVVLTEKLIAESLWSIKPFKLGTVPIERGLVEDAKELAALVSEDRYRITSDGLSKRWNPGACDAYYHANSDEHLEDGSLTEDAEPARLMIEKRMKKLKLIEEALPEPVVYGEAAGAEISFVGWGSTKNTILDIIDIYKERGIKVNYLHYSYVFPLKLEVARKFFADNSRVCLVEGNYQGQLGIMLEAALGVKFADRLLKWDGRPFFLEDLEKFIEKNNG